MFITNPATPDDISRNVCGTKEMDAYPILLRLRPPRLDLYARIIQANAENRVRLMFSFAVDYLRFGNNSIFLRQGLMLRMQSNRDDDDFAIFNNMSDQIDTSKIHYVVPVIFDADYVEAFVTANPEYAEKLEGMARVCFVREGYVILISAN
jgi:hypothetical protein